ncbi:Putative lumazine-binding [Chryseobacterium soldanellicola]|uniref:Putative lumazine-binding n=1 Tax=Chryseobacterium soldanellicola TaxID=311333 RepID=A0A1H1FQ17_9FLAO|nr:nuclear transport factor 2 family protein [Chryseobacterium soldanellicola]SDR02636.1 Putative lumazine-binding [Chryseobacterium soldanellicola]
MIEKEIRAMLERYFDVLQTQDLNEFDKVFNANCVLYSAQDNNFVVRPFQEYREMVINRKSPVELGSGRKDEVILLDILSDEMAFVKVRLQLFDNIMVDYLNIVKTDGNWSIVSKLFYREGSAV